MLPHHSQPLLFAVAMFVVVTSGVRAAAEPKSHGRTASKVTAVVEPPRSPPLVPEEKLAGLERRALVAGDFAAGAGSFRLVLEGVVSHRERARRRGEAWIERADLGIERRPWATVRQLAPGGGRTLAAALTGAAVQAVERGNMAVEAVEKREELERGLALYARAEVAWERQANVVDLEAGSAHEARFWLANARAWQVKLAMFLERRIDAELYARAVAGNVEVRNGAGDAKFLEPSAQAVVELADMLLQERYRVQRARGVGGIDEVAGIRTSGEGARLAIERIPLPGRVLRAIAARDEYVASVPQHLDANKNRLLFQYAGAQWLYLYGHLDEATARFEQIHREQCRKSLFGFKAWQRLHYLARIETERTGDGVRAAELESEDRDPRTSCQEIEVPRDRGDHITPGFFPEASQAFRLASKLNDGPLRVAAWREAARLYEEALRADPARTQAPEAAINGASAYKHVGSYGKAIEIYELFLSAYGRVRPPAEAPGRAGETRQQLSHIRSARRALASAYFLQFDYVAAAAVLEALAGDARFVQEERRWAAYNAILVRMVAGDVPRVAAAQRVFASLKPTPADLTQLEIFLSGKAADRWSREAKASPDGEAARARAEVATRRALAFIEAPRARHEIHDQLELIITMLHRLTSLVSEGAKLRVRQRTLRTFEALRAGAGDTGRPPRAGGPGEVAAEADYAIIDGEIARTLDLLRSPAPDSKRVDAVLAGFDARLSRIAEPRTYGSALWAATATARRAALAESVAAMHRAPELARAAQRRAVGVYTEAVLAAEKARVTSPELAHARRRLAHLTDVLGDDEMRAASAAAPAFTYTDGMWRARYPGLPLPAETSLLAAPAPPPAW